MQQTVGDSNCDTGLTPEWYGREVFHPRASVPFSMGELTRRCITALYGVLREAVLSEAPLLLTKAKELHKQQLNREGGGVRALPWAAVGNRMAMQCIVDHVSHLLQEDDEIEWPDDQVPSVCAQLLALSVQLSAPVPHGTGEKSRQLKMPYFTDCFFGYDIDDVWGNVGSMHNRAKLFRSAAFDVTRPWAPHKGTFDAAVWLAAKNKQGWWDGWYGTSTTNLYSDLSSWTPTLPTFVRQYAQLCSHLVLRAHVVRVDALSLCSLLFDSQLFVPLGASCEQKKMQEAKDDKDEKGRPAQDKNLALRPNRYITGLYLGFLRSVMRGEHDACCTDQTMEQKLGETLTMWSSRATGKVGLDIQRIPLLAQQMTQLRTQFDPRGVRRRTVSKQAAEAKESMEEDWAFVRVYTLPTLQVFWNEFKALFDFLGFPSSAYDWLLPLVGGEVEAAGKERTVARYAKIEPKDATAPDEQQMRATIWFAREQQCVVIGPSDWQSYTGVSLSGQWKELRKHREALLCMCGPSSSCTWCELVE
jgi:hypothetical protein